MISTLLCLAMTVSCVGAPQPADAAEVPTSPVSVRVVSANGSGCPQGTTDVAVASDNSEFTVTHHGYVARAGAGADPTDARKNCQLALDVEVPAGFAFGIVLADYRGAAVLRDGAHATQRASYYFQGSASTAAKSHPFHGPFADQWQTTDIADPVVYASCANDRLFNINTELRVSVGTSNPALGSFISMDAPDRNPNAHYKFAWKRC
jgi:hypothetical protein